MVWRLSLSGGSCLEVDDVGLLTRQGAVKMYGWCNRTLLVQVGQFDPHMLPLRFIRSALFCPCPCICSHFKAWCF